MVETNQPAILVTEDSRTQADRVRGILEREGYAVHWAADAEAALASLASRKFDLVVTDILMPGMDGFELCRRIKARDEWRDIPVVLLTALSEPDDVIRGLECGADSFVPKLYEEDLLVSRVRYTLANARSAPAEQPAGGSAILFQGKARTISSTPSQIVNFLLGAYEIALRKNEESAGAREELERLNARLENLVEERTLALREEIRERKRIHQALERREEQLRHAAKMEAVGHLAGGIAHDFNNLMTAVNGYSSLLLERFPEGDENHEYLSLIKQAGEKATALTSQLLAFGRRQMLAPRVIDLNQSVDNICRLLDRIIGSHIRIELRPGPGLWMTKVDPTQVEQVIMNLIINARDAMPGGGVLTLTTENIAQESDGVEGLTDLSPGDYVRLSVEDTGIGMPESVRRRIFEPFFTTKDRFKGTGLGLATAYGIIKQSGGDITVQSEPGKGSRFQVYLPRSSAEPDSEPSAKTPEGILSSRGNETILVAEDEDSLRKFVVGLLELKGYRVLAAEDGRAALDMACRSRQPIDLLLTDLTMPNMGGRELTKVLKETLPGLKVVFMSGFSEETSLLAGDRKVGVEFIAKPFTSAALWTCVRRVLDSPAGKRDASLESSKAFRGPDRDNGEG
jgi:signal transduction histidine kinase